MAQMTMVQYVGFEAKPKVREYSFTVKESEGEPRKFKLVIANEAFNSHRARYQDAPDICSQKLHRELAANENHLPQTNFHISDAELEDYRSAHAPKPSRGHYTPRSDHL